MAAAWGAARAVVVRARRAAEAAVAAARGVGEHARDKVLGE